MIRSDWTLAEVSALYQTPLFSLLSYAMKSHQTYHDPEVMQTCSLISIKTGGCPEDCKYCAQSSRYQTLTKAEPMLSFEEVKIKAAEALQRGATRICLGAAWRRIKEGRPFESILKMVKELTQMGAEVCCTLGTLTQKQAELLKEAGLYAYNHNLDTSRAFYPQIITTRTYDERLQTLEIVRKANITVCCGGIIGLGEKEEDRIAFLHTLCTLPSHPDSVPINLLHQISGTPLENQSPLPFWDTLRTIATARILMPQAMIRLSAGRSFLNLEQQALCFLVGANSIWISEKLLTVSNTDHRQDQEMFALFGLKPKKSNVTTNPKISS